MLLSFVFFFVGILTNNNRTRKNSSSLFAAMLSFMFLLLSVIYFSADYFTDEGINDAVIYHLFYGVEGGGIAEYYLIIVITLFLFLLSFVFAYFHYRIIKNSIHPKPKKIKAIISKVFLLAAVFLHPTVDAFSNFYQYGNTNDNDSEILESKKSFFDYYREPQIQSTVNDHPNFIYIYAESLERTYFDQSLFPGLIKGLSELESKYISFSNIEQVYGTGWTIAGMVSSQCGLPLVTPSGGNSMSGMDTFYSGAQCIGDLLHNQGYYLLMGQGSSIKFSGIETFYKTHHFDKIEGKSVLTSKIDDKTYVNHWGLYDDSLFDIAFEKFEKLSKYKNKFGLFLATIGTHHPEGHIPKECENIKYKNGSNPILNAVHCSDMQISNFVHKVQKSPYGKNTVIIIISDHLAMKNTATELLNKGNRKNMFIIIEPQKTPLAKQVKKAGTSFDIAPTFLHTLGFNTSLGLGRNLLGDDVSLVSQMENFSEHLKSWIPEISQFWNFKKINTDIHINAPNKKIYIGDTSYDFPILLKVDKELVATPFFEFRSPKKLYEYLIEAEKDKSFLWVDKCKKIRVLDSSLNNSGFCFISGKMGGELYGYVVDDNKIIPLKQIKEINKEEIDDTLAKTRKSALLNLKEHFYEKVYKKFIKGYQKLKIYFKSVYWTLIKKIEKPSKEEHIKIIKENKKIYYEDKQVVNRFIAHAGGEIDGYKYMNALEALDQNYKKGFRLFELDIIKTKDNVYVAAHDWEHWSKITGYKGSLPPTLDEFKKYKIKNKFTPLDMDAINTWFTEHPETILVTDKVNTPLDFSKKFIDKQRLMMELFSWQAVREGIEANIKSAMPTWNIVLDLKGDIVKKLVDIGITNIAASRRVIYNNKELMKKFQENGIRTYVFHVNYDEGRDETYVVCNELSEVYGLYADKWNFNANVNCD